MPPAARKVPEGAAVVESAAVRVPLAHAQAFRLEAAARGILRSGLKPYREAGRLVLPLDEPVAAHELEELASSFPGTEVARGAFEAPPRAPRSYREILDLPQNLAALLPSSWDVVGDVAIVKFKEALLPHAEAIGRAMLATHRSLRVVAHDRGVKGPHRVRDLAVVAGPGPLETAHREHGLDLAVDPSLAYFSPRLATERLRVARLVAPGERVLDLFAGVGPFSVLVARTERTATVDAIEINPDAYRLLARNAAAAKVADRVRTHLGDAREVAPRLVAAGGPYDRVLANLPHEAARFLDVAGPAARVGGTLHFYEILEKGTLAARGAQVAALLARHGGRWEPAAPRVLRNYSPTQVGAVIDLKRVI